ncbi:MAG: ATP-binding cassette domain-containing protein [Hydrotalea sp.]|nr:ATP-binding cassette domain-containing protein [Hydrotalea sp.]
MMLQLIDYQLLLAGKKLLGFKNLSVGHAGGRGNADILTLMGRSGVGKTSFLLDIAGLLTAGGSAEDSFVSRGKILLDGSNLRGVPSHQRRVAYMAQQPVVFPFLSVAENLSLAIPKKYDKKTRVKKIAWALQQCQMVGFEKRNTTTLSGGEVARLSLMMLILAEPKLLLLDEPFSALHKTLRGAMKKFVVDIVSKQKIPMIMVTHQREDALGKIILLKE